MVLHGPQAARFGHTWRKIGQRMAPVEAASEFGVGIQEVVGETQQYPDRIGYLTCMGE